MSMRPGRVVKIEKEDELASSMSTQLRAILNALNTDCHTKRMRIDDTETESDKENRSRIAMWTMIFYLVKEHNLEEILPEMLVVKYGCAKDAAQAIVDGFEFALESDSTNAKKAQLIVGKPEMFPFTMEEDDFENYSD